MYSMFPWFTATIYSHFSHCPTPYYHSCCSRALNQLNSSIFQISCHNKKNKQRLIKMPWYTEIHASFKFEQFWSPSEPPAENLNNFVTLGGRKYRIRVAPKMGILIKGKHFVFKTNMMLVNKGMPNMIFNFVLCLALDVVTSEIVLNIKMFLYSQLLLWQNNLQWEAHMMRCKEFKQSRTDIRQFSRGL